MKSQVLQELPPLNFPTSELSGHSRLPSISELVSVRNLHHLAHALDVAFCHYKPRGDNQVGRSPIHRGWRCPPEVLPEEPHRMGEWRECVHRAIYRGLLAGAVLSRAYNEPFHQLGDAADPSDLKRRRLNTLGQSSRVSPSEVRYLKEFAVYNRDATADAEDAVFGPFADWLIEDILARGDKDSFSRGFRDRHNQARSCRFYAYPPWTCPIDRGDYGGRSHADAHFVVLGLMQMMWASEHVTAAMLRNHSPLDYERFGLDNLAWKIAQRHADSHPEEGKQDLIKVPVVLFGVFQTEEIAVPKNVRFEKRPLLQASPAYRDPSQREDERTCAGAHVRTILHNIGFNDIHNTDFRKPPLLLKFFEYVLRRDFNLQIRQNSFRHHFSPRFGGYDDFINSFKLFALEGEDPKGPQYDLADGLEMLEIYNHSPR